MFDWLSNADNLKATGTIVSGLARGYGAVKQAEYTKDLLALQKADYNRGIQREDKAQSNLDSAMASSFGKKKKEPSMEIGV